MFRQVPDEPDAFYLYEAFVDQAAFEAHQKSEPFKKFVTEIVPNVIEPVIFVLRSPSALCRSPRPDCTEPPLAVRTPADEPAVSDGLVAR